MAQRHDVPAGTCRGGIASEKRERKTGNKAGFSRFRANKTIQRSDESKNMIGKYFPPSYGENQFHCIRCQVFARQDWYDMGYSTGGYYQKAGFRVSICSHCNHPSFWYGERMIVPADAPVAPPHPDLPDDCLLDFAEARGIFSQSPRSAAALLRLCIQKLMPHLGEDGKNINDDIKSLVAKGLSPLVQKALDYCRVVGNNAVHPGELNLNDTPEVAQKLFEMVNFIVDDRITKPREIEQLYNQLPETSRAAIDRRDGGSGVP